MCDMIGPRCLQVRYEDLVTNTQAELLRVLEWLGLDLEEDMMRHHTVMDRYEACSTAVTIAMMCRVRTSSMETTADQVVRPIYREALDSWRGNIPQTVLSDMNRDNLRYSAALRQFGYAPLD